MPGRIRHIWRGHSDYNDTHAIEKAAKWDQDFVWGVGAHTHASGLVREFNIGGIEGLAMLCGSYKVYDSYASMKGFPKPNRHTAVTIVFDANEEEMVGFSNIITAANYINMKR